MNKMFSYCKGLTKLDVSGLDTSQVTDMDAMFAVCINLTNIPVSNFNTSKVKDMLLLGYSADMLRNAAEKIQ